MIGRLERRAFHTVVGAVLLVPLVVGPIAAFGGLEGMARLFGVEGPIVVPVALRSGLRAICFLFVVFVPLVIWSLADLAGRAGAFRIVVSCAFLAGLARLTGYFVDGYPGVLPTLFLVTELAGMPILLLWHARLVRIANIT